MPIYEYTCPKCGHNFEEEKRITSDSETSECPECKSEARKIISLSSFKIIGYASINGYSKGNVKR